MLCTYSSTVHDKCCVFSGHVTSEDGLELNDNWKHVGKIVEIHLAVCFTCSVRLTSSLTSLNKKYENKKEEN
jgi:hypothetical protein